ncbi:LON peptidase substrate-binding domain-containing protein [Thioalkalivibrio sulfidiphilus]|uniref:LON peptidase substrate-binding domain-containing protein n=1 Tax=Thioalkalivibrio sulfidiphilus TaxID=1033854 RepID=UPI00035FD52F|nr:LON peptidase substrate-binding domain-containing protein [Thioalkalivibrio sulfidiphilus]
MITLPLFPLNTVLFPGGLLPLRIFETRYIDMVRQCLRTDSGFGVCMIREGAEVGQAAEVQPVGTLAMIADWEGRPDGLLGITARGERRFRILRTWVQPDQLLMGEVEWLDEPAATPLPEEFLSLATLAERILTELGEPYASLPREPDNAVWVGARLAELLPVDHTVKQRMLETDDPLARLFMLRDAMLNHF